MQRVLEMMLDAILDTWAVAAPYLRAAIADVPVWAWASIVTLVLLWMAVRMLRPTRVEAGAAPDLLLTRADLVADGPSTARFRVDLGFSNLHHEPVQLLRLAVVGRAGRPVVRDVPAIVGGRRAVDLASDVELLPGGRGRLDLYAVVPASPARAWRVRVPLAWEPFGRRYAGVLLDQKVTAVRRLPNVDEGMPAVVPSRSEPGTDAPTRVPAPPSRDAGRSSPASSPPAGRAVSTEGTAGSTSANGHAPSFVTPPRASRTRDGAKGGSSRASFRRAPSHGVTTRGSRDADAAEEVARAPSAALGAAVVAPRPDPLERDALSEAEPVREDPARGQAAGGADEHADRTHASRDEGRAPDATKDEDETASGRAATARTPRLRFPDRF